MASGIRAEVKIDDPDRCVVTTVVGSTEGSVNTVSKIVSVCDDGRTRAL